MQAVDYYNWRSVPWHTFAAALTSCGADYFEIKPTIHIGQHIERESQKIEQQSQRLDQVLQGIK